MKLSAPTQVVFLIAVIIAVLSLVSAYVTAIPVIVGNEFIMMTVAFVILAVANLIKDF